MMIMMQNLKEESWPRKPKYGIDLPKRTLSMNVLTWEPGCTPRLCSIRHTPKLGVILPYFRELFWGSLVTFVHMKVQDTF